MYDISIFVRFIVMSSITFMFNKPKAIETILYLAHKISNPDRYGICKLLYLADKVSLANYGRFIFGESYVAMEEGATPSRSYDLLKNAAAKSINGLKVEGNKVIAQRPPNLDYLSESDIECLDLIISKYGYHPKSGGKDAHDAAWQTSWDQRGLKRSVKIPVESIARLFTDSDDLISYLSKCDVK